MAPASFLYIEIAESIRRLIASGQLAPGDKLPPVRQMAQRWDCAPGTVGRAYATLAQEGLVAGHGGSGTRVGTSALQAEQPVWQWAALVNLADRYLLEAVSRGHSPAQAEVALSLAVNRWHDMQGQGVPEAIAEPRSDERALRFAGSHDLLVESLARMMSERPAATALSMEYTGSLGGLIALAQHTADIAGAHLWDEGTDSYNTPYVRRLLPGRRLALLTLAHRSLGLILPAGNPQGLGHLRDLVQAEVQLVNRQPGSGTRVWLDAQLKALEIRPESVRGYEREELTHLAVARAVAQGEATVGLGIYAAASAYGLSFAPLTQERYDLVIPEEVWNTPAVRALVEAVRSPQLREIVAALGGYDTSETGRETWVS